MIIMIHSSQSSKSIRIPKSTKSAISHVKQVGESYHTRTMGILLSSPILILLSHPLTLTQKIEQSNLQGLFPEKPLDSKRSKGTTPLSPYLPPPTKHHPSPSPLLKPPHNARSHQLNNFLLPVPLNLSQLTELCFRYMAAKWISF